MVKQETNYFLDLSVNMSKTIRDTSKVTSLLMTNRKLYMRFRLAPRWMMTFDDPELL